MFLRKLGQNFLAKLLRKLLRYFWTCPKKRKPGCAKSLSQCIASSEQAYRKYTQGALSSASRHNRSLENTACMLGMVGPFSVWCPSPSNALNYRQWSFAFWPSYQCTREAAAFSSQQKWLSRRQASSSSESRTTSLPWSPSRATLPRLCVWSMFC